ncbi:lipid droplet-associated protein [Nakamurella leprariae]|uniref:Lipid droplet-associated protein n=1 Tax=Nakamurella leprariae TaxID=2803911 RepID=A0A938YEV2_9ACTN|nr:lipid droplet-associated protein [Nakamurella leprariae]MBM9468313.1 lipid droplet-associated protein [Nakamurella leprariae]
MAITLPTPVYVAAGLLATGIDRVRRLPEELPTLPVTVAGSAVRWSMKVQQELAALAGRGEQFLADLTGREEDSPAWARFDDDEDDAADAAADDAADAAGAMDPADAATTVAGEPVPATPASTAPAGATEDAGPTPVAPGTPSDDGAPVPHRTGGRRTARAAAPTAPTGAAPGAIVTEPAEGAVVADPPVIDPAAPPAGLASGTARMDAVPDYPSLTLAQLKGRLGEMSASQVRDLLEFEQQHEARAPFLTLLTNRLTTLGTTDR